MPEVNFDGLIGPTHNYGGLAYGNVASMANKHTVSNPRLAALQGLEKMWYLASLGIPQGIIPPQERPNTHILRRLGYGGTDMDIIQKIGKTLPELWNAVCSASSMWVANSAIVSPSCDTHDGLVHITPANLLAKFHRSIETTTTEKLLKVIFSDTKYFVHHTPLFASPNFSDEGAANHTRFCKGHSLGGVNLFTYGRHSFKPNVYLPQIFPARQTIEASKAITRLHLLSKDAIVFVQQHPKAIDAGAFHNDVIAVGNCNALFYHEYAYIESGVAIDEIQSKVHSICGVNMNFIKVLEKQVSLKEAIETYLFNSQLITMPDGFMALIAPTECQQSPAVYAYLEEMIKDSSNPISHVHYINIRESMRNGGGPACLRLRVVLSEDELSAVNPNFLLDEKLYTTLKEWITNHYRDKLTPADLFDPKLITESREALNVLSKILNVNELYEFQRS